MHLLVLARGHSGHFKYRGRKCRVQNVENENDVERFHRAVFIIQHLHSFALYHGIFILRRFLFRRLQHDIFKHVVFNSDI